MTDVYEVRHEVLSASVRPAETASTGAAEAAFHRQLQRGAERRAASAGWSSSLCESDLACLMSVLERDVLPRIVGSYRPADGLRLERCTG